MGPIWALQWDISDRSCAVLLLWIFNGGFSVLCLLCLCARLFICALWSPAGKGLTSWLSFVVYNANASFLCPIGAVLLSTKVIWLRKK